MVGRSHGLEIVVQMYVPWGRLGPLANGARRGSRQAARASAALRPARPACCCEENGTRPNG